MVYNSGLHVLCCDHHFTNEESIANSTTIHNRWPNESNTNIQYDCVALGGNIANPRMRYLRYFGTFSRTLTMVWMLSFLILRNAYQCSLYDFLHTQKVASPLDTIEGIKNSDVDIIIDRNGLSFMEQFFDRERYVFEFCAMHVILII